jgi:outer membrane lipase/esterase
MFIIVRTTLLALLLSVSGHALAKNDLPFSRVYVLGTSLSDEGNAFIQCGMQSVPPYDNLTPQLFAPGDSPYARGGHHFSNGSTWVEALAKELGVTNSVLPVRRNPQGTNYAQAGTTALPATLDCRITFGDQVTDVLARGPIPADALVIVEIGSNDVFNALELFVGAYGVFQDVGVAKAFAIANSLNPAADLTVAGIETLINPGGASTVLWANVPNLGLTPAAAISDMQAQMFVGLPEGEFIDAAVEFAAVYNGRVRDKIESQIAAGTIVELDLFESLTKLVTENPRGLLNVSDLCVTPNVPPFACRKPDNYLFWDSIHPTKAGHELFAEDALVALGLI